MMNKRVILSSILVLLAAGVSGQRYLGVATGNYNSIGSLYLNPANIAASREKVVVSLVSVGMGVDNSLGTFTNLNNLGNSNTNAFNIDGTQPFSMLIPVLELRLPGVMVSLNDKHRQALALTARIRGINQFSHFDPSLYNTITSSEHTANETYTLHSSDFNWTANVWSELAFTYGIEVVQKGPHQFKAGATVRYLGGVSYLSLKGRNLNASYTAGSDTFFAHQSDLEFSSNAINSDDVKSDAVKPADIFGSLFGSRSGSGIGMDIGVTYTYDPGAADFFGSLDDDEHEIGHELRISAAVTDVGAIKYKAGNNFFVNVSGDGYLTGKGLTDNLDNSSKFREYVTGQGFNADTGSRAQKLYMPTAAIAGVDYQVYHRVYLNVTYIANLANRNNYGNSYYNQFTITPRYDTRLITAALPITFSSLAHDMKVGLGFRVAGFFIGSDDMLAVFSSKQRGFGFYLGGYVPIYRKKAKEDYYK